jgi:hypothetical protein
MHRVHEAESHSNVLTAVPQHVEAPAEAAEVEPHVRRSVDTITVKPWTVPERTDLSELAEPQVEQPQPYLVQPETDLEASTGLGTPTAYVDFEARFADIRNEITRHEHPMVGAGSAKEAYIDEETESKQLLKFGKLMLAAPSAAQEEIELNRLRARGRLSPTQRDKMNYAKRMLCAYNQLLSSLIRDNEEALPRQKLKEWMIESSHGNEAWARRTLAGAAAEVAAEKLLSEVVTNVEHGDLDQDLKGQDLVFDETPSGYSSVDVKLLASPTGNPVEPGLRGNLTLYIDPSEMDHEGYEVLPEHAEMYKISLEHALMGDQTDYELAG